MRTIDSQARRSPRRARSTSSDSSSGRSTTAASTPVAADRFPELRRPNLALDELDRVAGRIANVERATARSPGVLVLDLDVVPAEASGEGVQVINGERDVARPAGPV